MGSSLGSLSNPLLRITNRKRLSLLVICYRACIVCLRSVRWPFWHQAGTRLAGARGRLLQQCLQSKELVESEVLLLLVQRKWQ